MPDPEQKKSGIRGAFISLLVLCIGFGIGKWTEKQQKENFDQRIDQQRSEKDIEWTGVNWVGVKLEGNKTTGPYHFTRFVDHDGLLKVEIRDMGNKLVWEKSLDDYEEPTGNSWRKNQNGDYTSVYLTVPNIQGGTYSVTVFDQKGSSFTKEVLFEDILEDSGL